MLHLVIATNERTNREVLFIPEPEIVLLCGKFLTIGGRRGLFPPLRVKEELRPMVSSVQRGHEFLYLAALYRLENLKLEKVHLERK